MASLSRFSDVSEEELNALIQTSIPEKTKRARKHGIKNFKGKKEINLDISIYSTNNRWCIISIGCLNKFNNSLSKKYRSFVSSSEISTKTSRILALNFYR